MPPAFGKCSTRKLAALALLLAAMLLSGACTGHDPDARFDNYLSRLARTLGVEAQTPTPAHFPRPPRSGNVRLDVPPGSLNALDFLSLRGCELQLTVGKRNSSLGRMARASQTLLLELEFLRLAPACIAYLEAENRDELAATLARAREVKRAQLPARIFNATLGSEEYRAFWQRARPAGTYPASGSAAAAALTAINAYTVRWLNGDYRADGGEFELLLSEVAGGGGGALLAQLLRQQAWLDAASELLARRQARGPLCAPGIRHEAAQILPNVVRKYFIGEIQPHAAALGRSQYRLLPPVTALESRLADTLPAVYRQGMTHRNTLLAEAIAAPQRHVAALQAIEAPCTGLERIAPREA